MVDTLTKPKVPGSTPRRGFDPFSIFRPDPPAPRIQDPVVAKRLTLKWQRQIMVSAMIGYILFYLVRKNLSFAMPVMEKHGISKAALGGFLTCHGVVYGVSKFANGFLGDRANARSFMITGLALSALANVFFGFGSAVAVLGVLWVINGWTQGMGFPPCARLMTHWFPPRILATRMTLWNTSHSIGAGLGAILCGYLAARNWRLCFYVPAAIALVGCVYLFFTLKDTPESMGLPEPEGSQLKAVEASGDDGNSQWKFLCRNVFNNPFIWIIALANFFVYAVRFTVLDWGPTLLSSFKGYRIEQSGWIMAGFEVSGCVGMLLSGWITDRLFGGRGSRTCVAFMLGCAAAMYAFWKIPNQTPVTSTAILAIAGFFIYGPQALVGISVSNLATKRAAATAVGLTGLFGYFSTTYTGSGVAYLVKHYGWNAGLGASVGLSIVGAALFILAWPAKADGYGDRN